MKIQISKRKGLALADIKAMWDYTPPLAKSEQYFKDLFSNNPPKQLTKVSKYRNSAAYKAETKKYEIFCVIKTTKSKPDTINIKTRLTIDKIISRFDDVAILCKSCNQRANFRKNKFQGVSYYDQD